MIYLAAVVLGLAQLALAPHIHLLGGQFWWLPTLVLLSAAEGWWRSWLIALIALGLVRFYAPFPFLIVVIMLAGSALLYYAFSRWIEKDSFWARLVGANVLIAAIFLVGYSIVLRQLTWAGIGSLVISLPLIIAWCWYLTSQQRLRRAG